MALVLKSDVLLEKNGVGVQPSILLAILVANGVYEANGVRECMITSLLDGQHMIGSLHYKGRAVDLRTKGTGLSQRLYEGVRKALPLNLYDVLLEDKDGPNEHLHLEFDVHGS